MGKKGGKAPQGRAKQKQKAQKAGSSASPWSRNKYDDFSEEDEDTPNVTFRGFGGATKRNTIATDPSVKLRHRSIAFISAGTNTPREEETDEARDAETSTPQEQEVGEALIAAIELNDHDVSEEEEELAAQVDGSMDVEEETTVIVDTAESQGNGISSSEMEVEQESLSFVVDTVGETTSQQPVHWKTVDQLLRRSPSPTPSDSSEEVILFRGRNKAVVINDPIEPTQSAVTKAGSPSAKSTAWEDKPLNLVSEQAASVPGFTPTPEGIFWRKGGPRNIEELEKATSFDQSHAQSTASTAPQQEAGQETIEMLQAAWKQAKKDKSARKQELDSDVDRISRRGKRGRKQSNKLLRSINADDIDPEEAAYQDYLDNLRTQEEDEEVGEEEAIPDVANVEQANDEQEWEDVDATADSDDENIGDDLSDVLDDDDDLNASDLESSELDEELERAEQEILDAEDALYMRRIQSKSDAQIARLWAKQVELGIESDELVIDDGDNLDGFGDLAAARAGFEEYIGLSGKRHKRGGKRDVSFPDASAFADTIEQYGNEGFDIMDYNRPSLRPTKKGRKGKLPPELDTLSDEDLKENMMNAWDNDRAKKRLKKAEREELRSQGLLGSLAKKGKADLGMKYRQGMTMEQIHDELAIFLEDEGKTTQPFPPMDKADRKALHMVADALNLKSKSVGSGNARYPVLYKTHKTLDYDETMFKRIIQRSSRGFLKNQTYKGGSKGIKPIKRSGGAGMAATGLRHGEMVGAGAKEIGQENKGHRLMERMGWTKGMALGRDGEGVLEPIEQMMRVGRAGLG